MLVYIMFTSYTVPALFTLLSSSILFSSFILLPSLVFLLEIELLPAWLVENPKLVIADLLYTPKIHTSFLGWRRDDMNYLNNIRRIMRNDKNEVFPFLENLKNSYRIRKDWISSWIWENIKFSLRPFDENQR